jgi:hypothetical protein
MDIVRTDIWSLEHCVWLQGPSVSQGGSFSINFPHGLASESAFDEFSDFLVFHSTNSTIEMPSTVGASAASATLAAAGSGAALTYLDQSADNFISQAPDGAMCGIFTTAAL